MHSCEYWEIFKNTCFEKYLRTVAPEPLTNNDGIGEEETITFIFSFTMKNVIRPFFSECYIDLEVELMTGGFSVDIVPSPFARIT